MTKRHELEQELVQKMYNVSVKLDKLVFLPIDEDDSDLELEVKTELDLLIRLAARAKDTWLTHCLSRLYYMYTAICFGDIDTEGFDKLLVKSHEDLTALSELLNFTISK